MLVCVSVLASACARPGVSSALTPASIGAFGVPAALGWMDTVLLTALERQPERGPELFHALFARCPPGPLVRFLNEVGGIADCLQVVAAMPKAPMLGAALRFGR